MLLQLPPMSYLSASQFKAVATMWWKAVQLGSLRVAKAFLFLSGLVSPHRIQQSTRLSIHTHKSSLIHLIRPNSARHRAAPLNPVGSSSQWGFTGDLPFISELLKHQLPASVPFSHQEFVWANYRTNKNYAIQIPNPEIAWYDMFINGIYSVLCWATAEVRAFWVGFL